MTEENNKSGEGMKEEIEKDLGKLNDQILRTLKSQLALYVFLFLIIAILFLSGIWGKTKFNQILAIFNFGVLGISIGLKMAEITRWKVYKKYI